MRHVTLSYPDGNPSDVYYGDTDWLFADERGCAAVVIHRDARYLLYFYRCTDGGCPCNGGHWRIDVEAVIHEASEPGALDG